MDDTNPKPVAVLNKSGQRETDSRGNLVVRQGLTGPIQAESRADAYLRQMKGRREEWPGQFEAQAKKYRDEDAASASPSPSPSPSSAQSPAAAPSPAAAKTETEDEEYRRRAPIKPTPKPSPKSDY